MTSAELPLADREPLVAVARTEFPQPDKLTTSTLNDRFAVAPAEMAPCVQTRPEHDQPEAFDNPSSDTPVGSEIWVVRPLVAAVPGSDTPTLTTAVTPRLSTLFTLTATPSRAVAPAEVCEVGDGLGVGVGDAVGDELVELDGCGLGEPDVDLVGFGFGDFDELGEADGLPFGEPGWPEEADADGETEGTGPDPGCGSPGWPPEPWPCG